MFILLQKHLKQLAADRQTNYHKPRAHAPSVNEGGHTISTARYLHGEGHTISIIHIPLILKQRHYTWDKQPTNSTVMNS